MDLTALQVVGGAGAGRIRVLVPTQAGHPVPSVAGILTFGVFPQQFFPQLTISVVVFPSGANFGEDISRFEDNPVVRGAIPDLVADTISVLRRYISVRSYVNGSGRREQPDYPVEAVREAIVNAVLHHDYSNVTRGTQIQVELHPDRLVGRGPGSLYGLVRVENLGTEGMSSSRTPSWLPCCPTRTSRARPAGGRETARPASRQ